jgi:predicted transporter
MSLIVDVARLSAAINVVLLLTLAYVWADSYLQVRSKHTLGALMFSLFLLAENVLGLYYYLTAISLPAAAMQAMMTLQVLEMLGLALLVYVTWD